MCTWPLRTGYKVTHIGMDGRVPIRRELPCVELLVSVVGFKVFPVCHTQHIAKCDDLDTLLYYDER
jgi:hypothetical protein